MGRLFPDPQAQPRQAYENHQEGQEQFCVLYSYQHERTPRRAGEPARKECLAGRLVVADGLGEPVRNYLKLGLVLKGEHIGGSVKLGETWVVVDDGKERYSAHYMGSTR